MNLEILTRMMRVKFIVKNLSEFDITEGPETLSKYHDKVITNLVPDCPSPCSNEDYVPFLNNPLNKEQIK